MPSIAASALRTLWPQSQLLLNTTLVNRGIEHQGDDSRLACVRAALTGGGRVHMSAVGGSITASGGGRGWERAAGVVAHVCVQCASDSDSSSNRSTCAEFGKQGQPDSEQ